MIREFLYAFDSPDFFFQFLYFLPAQFQLSLQLTQLVGLSRISLPQLSIKKKKSNEIELLIKKKMPPTYFVHGIKILFNRTYILN